MTLSKNSFRLPDCIIWITDLYDFYLDSEILYFLMMEITKSLKQITNLKITRTGNYRFWLFSYVLNFNYVTVRPQFV